MRENAVRVGVAGDGPGRSLVEDALGATDVTILAGDPATLADEDVDYVVTIGEAALVELVRAAVRAPVLPVEAGQGVRSVPRAETERAVADLVAGRWTPVEHPVLVADHPGGRARALFDFMLVTDDPARISEYGIATGGTHVATFRADGVVVGSAAGSTGYARDAGGAVVAPGTDVVVVVPVAPFATSTDDWVLPIGGVHLTVEREETPVVLLADDREVDEIPVASPVTVSTERSLTVATVEGSRSFYATE